MIKLYKIQKSQGLLIDNLPATYLKALGTRMGLLYLIYYDLDEFPLTFHHPCLKSVKLNAPERPYRPRKSFLINYFPPHVQS